MSRRSTRLAVLLAALALLFAACGTTDGDDAGDTPATEGTTATDGTTEEPDVTEDTTEEPDVTEDTAGTDDDVTDPEAQARAESIVIAPEVAGPDWVGTPASQDDDEDSPIDACDPIFADDDIDIGRYSNDDLEKGDLNANDGLLISIDTTVFVDVDTATRAADAFADADVVSCISDVFSTQFGDAPGELVVEEDVEPVADQFEAISGSFTPTDPNTGEEVDVRIVIGALRTGDMLTLVLAVAANAEPDGAALQAVLEEIVTLQAAAA